jgi:rod shape determining protein RodA
MLGIAGCGLIYMLLFSRRKWKEAVKTGLFTALAIGIVFSVDFFFYKMLKPHQQKRIEVLINPDIDAKGIGWQVNQSKIAIGSGGFMGKGFLEGTQTKFNFVPDQSTDFIFCTIAEERGWIGSLFLITLFVVLLNRLLIIAERQKSRFSRVYAYGALSILFFHFTVNIGMTIGLFPVIGIPLPFFSYGGSSLWSFTLLLFILLKLDMHRKMQITGSFS